jgi:GH15 family glucan-1,4-alpha-glucosidase
MDGTIDWLCLPHFDSPSLFASILDHARGGYFRVAAESAEARRRQMYLPDSNVLVTRFLTSDGVGEVVDFMPIETSGELPRGEASAVVRIVRGIRGSIPFRMECRPAFDYAREKARIEPREGGFRFSGSGCAVDFQTTLECRRADDGLSAEFVLEEGEEIPVVLSVASRTPLPPVRDLLAGRQKQFRSTLKYWQEWIGRSRYQGRWREMVKRSALTLKLLTFAPTGAIVAAPTASLPERIGGDRNWDYRYTWIRDAAFTVHALLQIGFAEEAERFMGFLEGRFRETGAGEGLRVLYGIDGRLLVPETTLDHLEGYRGSAPVRVGNGAARQFQLDITGEMMDAAYLCNKYSQPVSHGFWLRLRGLADWVCDHWQEPDDGIWEMRGACQQFTFSKLMCWVALDRAERIANGRSLPGARQRWSNVRDEIYETIMQRGFSEEKRSFVQSLDSSALDASMLLAPLVKFVTPSDPRMLGTLDAVKRELESDHLVRRYDPRVCPDGIGGDEGTFSMCTFWLAEALARAGRLEEARLTFEKMLGYANHLGLYSEEIGLTGEALGNFPQALTHLGLISAAVSISQLLDREQTGRQSPAAEI